MCQDLNLLDLLADVNSEIWQELTLLDFLDYGNPAFVGNVAGLDSSGTS